jgi:hypothetical protein|tara:strand:+ start:302 stop:568 length:267 start_codon:yes stop_codon:yes gene_type:complete
MDESKEIGGKINSRTYEKLLLNNPNIKLLEKCLVPGCKDAEQVKGLCPKHYQHARRLVNKDETTWVKLYKKGKAKRKKSATTDWFLEG